MNVAIEEGWKEVLQEEFDSEYFEKLSEFVKQEYKTKTIYPPAGKIFNAFNLCSFKYWLKFL